MAEVSAVPDRSRRLLCLVLLASMLHGGAGLAQDTMTLRPGEEIEFPGVTVSVLGLKVSRGASTTVVQLRLRAVAGAGADAMVGLESFRLIAAGVPRAPVYDTTDERIMSSFLVERESATDFTRVFRISERTDDLVLQIRINDAVERRRLPPG